MLSLKLFFLVGKNLILTPLSNFCTFQTFAFEICNYNNVGSRRILNIVHYGNDGENFINYWNRAYSILKWVICWLAALDFDRNFVHLQGIMKLSIKKKFTILCLFHLFTKSIESIHTFSLWTQSRHGRWHYWVMVSYLEMFKILKTFMEEAFTLVVCDVHI